MNLTDLYILAQSEVEKPTLFPFPFGLHIVFTIIGVVFLVYRFMKQRYPYQIIIATAMPILLLLWTSESRTLFYGVGIVELILVLAALATSIFCKKPEDRQKNNSAENSENTEAKE